MQQTGIATFEQLPLKELRAEWAKHYGVPPLRSPDLLRLIFAWSRLLTDADFARSMTYPRLARRFVLWSREFPKSQKARRRSFQMASDKSRSPPRLQLSLGGQCLQRVGSGRSREW